METLCLSARTSSITVRKTSSQLVDLSLRVLTVVCPLSDQTTWTDWEAAWRTGVCSGWRTAACFWSAAPSLRERSSTGSCRSPTMIASKRSVSTSTHTFVLPYVRRSMSGEGSKCKECVQFAKRVLILMFKKCWVLGNGQKNFVLLIWNLICDLFDSVNIRSNQNKLHKIKPNQIKCNKTKSN